MESRIAHSTEKDRQKKESMEFDILPPFFTLFDFSSPKLSTVYRGKWFPHSTPIPKKASENIPNVGVLRVTL